MPSPLHHGESGQGGGPRPCLCCVSGARVRVSAMTPLHGWGRGTGRSDGVDPPPASSSPAQPRPEASGSCRVSPQYRARPLAAPGVPPALAGGARHAGAGLGGVGEQGVPPHHAGAGRRPDPPPPPPPPPPPRRRAGGRPVPGMPGVPSRVGEGQGRGGGRCWAGGAVPQGPQGPQGPCPCPWPRRSPPSRRRGPGRPPPRAGGDAGLSPGLPSGWKEGPPPPTLLRSPRDPAGGPGSRPARERNRTAR